MNKVAGEIKNADTGSYNASLVKNKVEASISPDPFVMELPRVFNNLYLASFGLNEKDIIMIHISGVFPEETMALHTRFF